MTIWFDMDGTLADLYGVENWLPMLRASDPTPYMVARPLVNLSALARVLNRLQREGYEIGVISWTSMLSPMALPNRSSPILTTIFCSMMKQKIVKIGLGWLWMLLILSVL